VEATLEDIAVANRLANEVLGRSLDELPPQTRRFLNALDTMVRDACGHKEVARVDYRFSRRQVREHTRLSYEQVRVHLQRLVELEYVLVHRGKRGQSYEYELLWNGEGRDGSPFVMSLLDVELLRGKGMTASLGGLEPQLPGSYRGHTGPIPGGYRSTENGSQGVVEGARPQNPDLDGETALIPVKTSVHRSVHKVAEA
jgi:hypothetical protein